MTGRPVLTMLRLRVLSLTLLLTGLVWLIVLLLVMYLLAPSRRRVIRSGCERCIESGDIFAGLRVEYLKVGKWTCIRCEKEIGIRA